MKESKKQIKAQVVNEVRRQYDDKLIDKDNRIANLNKVVNDLSKHCREKEIEIDKLSDENSLLKEKVSLYEDWIERMKEFCGLPDGERQKEFKTYVDGLKAQKEKDDIVKETADFFNRMTTVMFM
jgi:hypothetical protein